MRPLLLVSLYMVCGCVYMFHYSIRLVVELVGTRFGWYSVRPLLLVSLYMVCGCVYMFHHSIRLVVELVGTRFGWYSVRPLLLASLYMVCGCVYMFPAECIRGMRDTSVPNSCLLLLFSLQDYNCQN